MAADVLGRLERAGAAIADVLALYPTAVADLRTQPALRRFCEWRDTSRHTHDVISDLMWAAVDAMPAAEARLCVMRNQWRRLDRRTWTPPVRLIVPQTSG